MESKLFLELNKYLQQNKKVAVIILTKVSGSTPRTEGAMMLVTQDGITQGTIGGGSLEKESIVKAIECIESDKSACFDFDLTANGDLNMQCGGKAEVFIKTFSFKSRLIIAGAGHIAVELNKLGKMLDFHTVVFDDRVDFCNRERFYDADELIVGDMAEVASKLEFDENSFLVIVTRGHQHDQEVLEKVLDKQLAYVGMIGSKNKTKHIMDNLIKEGVSQEKLEKVYAPIGLALGGKKPAEIAISIISEILMVKNQGVSISMKQTIS